MRWGHRGLCDLCLLAAALIVLAAPASPTRAQTAVATDDIVTRLANLETAPNLDLAELRKRAIERVKAKAKTDQPALKRPIIAPELLKLPQVSFDVLFDPDSSVVRPQAYETLGRIADALTRSTLLAYGFLIVAHTESNGKREYNLALSQKRADSIRDALVNTFKLSPKRIQAIGLGEEQMRDANQPAAAVNQQAQIVTIAKAL
jgi:OOP family OmpA-OmpF porin